MDTGIAAVTYPGAEEVRAVADTAPATRDSWWRRLGRESAYCLTAFPIALPAFIVVVVLVVVGASLTLILVGLPLLALGLAVARGVAFLERQRLGRLTRTTMAHPAYLEAAPGDGILRRLTLSARDRQTWLDVVWVVVALFTGTVCWAVTLAWWVAGVGGSTYGVWQRLVPQGSDQVTLASLMGLGSTRAADVFVISAIGFAALVTLPLVVRTVTLLHSTLGRDLLCERAELQQQVRRSEAGRAAGRAAEAESLRRLERDIHDGPQQRLVRLSMDLGRARSQLDQDPELARATLDGALSQARETVDELRSLSRGIAPPVLVDRGLEAALREAVARSVVPTTLTYRAPASLPAHIENAAYFVVAESLTNIAKHSGATRAAVSLVLEGDLAVVEVQDDGHGGAVSTPGGGLAGLAQRARAVDGRLQVTSPPGGPTVLRTELPCA